MMINQLEFDFDHADLREIVSRLMLIGHIYILPATSTLIILYYTEIQTTSSYYTTHHSRRITESILSIHTPRPPILPCTSGAICFSPDKTFANPFLSH